MCSFCKMCLFNFGVHFSWVCCVCNVMCVCTVHCAERMTQNGIKQEANKYQHNKMRYNDYDPARNNLNPFLNCMLYSVLLYLLFVFSFRFYSFDSIYLRRFYSICQNANDNTENSSFFLSFFLSFSSSAFCVCPRFQLRLMRIQLLQKTNACKSLV